MILSIVWMKKWSDGSDATIQDLVSVLANAPESVVHTELVRTFIDDFYNVQKQHLVLRGFVPFTIYLIGVLGYLTVTRESLRQQVDNSELVMSFYDYAFTAILIIGTTYFTVLEFIQAKTLKSQYLKKANAADIAYLTINFCFIIDLFTEVMSSQTAMRLSLAQAVLLGIVLINWLRVFETTVIYIRLI